MSDGIGQFGVVVGQGSWVARVIQWATNSPAYHVQVRVDHGWTAGMESGGCRVRPEGNLSGYGTVLWSDVKLTDEQKHTIITVMLEAQFAHYSYLDDVLIGLNKLAARANTRVGKLIARLFAPVLNLLQRDKHYECAEIVDIAYRAAGIDLFKDGLPPGARYPSDFYNLLPEYMKAA